MRWGPPAKRRGPASDTLWKQEEDWQWNVKVSYGTRPRPSGSVRNFACESSMINGARKPPGSTMSFRRFGGGCATPGTPIGGSAEMCGTTCDAASTHWWRSERKVGAQGLVRIAMIVEASGYPLKSARSPFSWGPVELVRSSYRQSDG
jgi:hypothetical protein